MFCIHCGAEINDAVKFCSSCGAAQKISKESIADVNKSDLDIPEYPKASSGLVDKHEELSIEEVLKISEQHDPIAWVVLGDRYQDGKGVEQNNDEAFKWYKKSANVGEPWGINNLGRAYDNAWGVEKDEEMAADYYHQAAKLGWKPAMANYAWMLVNGSGVEKNYKQAFKWYRLGAERGDARCQYDLGSNYQKGVGVEQDDSKAIYWFQKAVKQNNSSALLSLGWMHAKGRGVEKNLAKGHDLFLQSAELGNSTAACHVATDYENGQGVEEDLNKANKWYLKAAEAGSTKGMFNLGCNYEFGIGFAKDWSKAKKWYQKAADNGHKEADFRAQFRMFDMYDYGGSKKKVGNITFYRTAGTVLDHKRSSETHVSSSGGGGYMGRHGGHVAAAQVESTVINTDDIWIETENGNEKQISLTNYKVALRPGQKISVFHAILEGKDRGPYMCLVNHSDGQTRWLKSSEQFIEDSTIYSQMGGCFSCLSCLLVIPLILILPMGYARAKDTKKISKGIDAHLLKIEAWAKNNAEK